MGFAQKFLALRKKSGLSQEDVAEKLNVSRQAVSRWEMGTAYPDALNLLQISKLFGVSADYLIDDGITEQTEIAPSREITPPAAAESGRHDLKRAAYPFLIAAAVAGAVFETIAAIIGLYGGLTAAIVLTVLGCALLVADIVAFAIIYRPSPVLNNQRGYAIKPDKTTFKFWLAECFHMGAFILELTGFVLFFASDPVLTCLLTGFGAFLSVAGIIFFECLFRKHSPESRKAARRKYYRICVWFQAFLITNLIFITAMYSGGHIIIGGAIAGSVIAYLIVCALVNILLRDRKK